VFWWWRGTARSAGGPIIFISIDTLRADRLPVYGYRGVQTPAIDALARDGIVFERAYAHAPQTLPSHASILSGRLPFETGVRDNVGFVLKPDQPLLPDLLRTAGYATGGAVSSFVLRKETGIGRGFDVYDSLMPEAAPDKPIGQIERRGGDTLAAATRWMAGLSSPRFFLFFHLYEPHKPYAPPERFKAYAPYDGEIAWSDETVGRLVAWLKARGLYDTATIVLFSDHGEGLGDHGEQEHGLFLYDETIRSALVVKLPRGRRAGQRVTVPVQHIDLVPTALDLAGAPARPGLRGRSLRALLERGSDDTGDAGFYAEALYGRYHYGWSELYALTDSRFRFIKAPRAELYDLERDPGERLNIAPDRAQAVAAMRSALDRLLSGASLDRPSAVSKEDLERLQALGYIGSQVDVSAASSDTLPDPKDKIGVLEAHRRVVELASSRAYGEAIALTRSILADNPAMKDLWLQLGVLQVRAGHLPEALDAFKRLVDVDPRDGASLVSVAQVLLQLGRLLEARDHAAAALGLLANGAGADPDAAYEVLVKVALARRDGDEARRQAALAQRADATSPLPTYADARLLYDQGRFAEALPQFQATIKAIGARTIVLQDLYYYTGDTLARLGEEAAAASAFRTETRLSPENVRAHAGLAMLYRAGGQAAKADEVIAQMLRAVPTEDGYAMAIRLRTVFGDRDKAAALRRDAVARFGAAAVSAAEARVRPKPRTLQQPGA
jgi:arylsulfatase A-like enzyme/Tfp pilus assembly protein PilF